MHSRSGPQKDEVVQWKNIRLYPVGRRFESCPHPTLWYSSVEERLALSLGGRRFEPCYQSLNKYLLLPSVEVMPCPRE